MQAASLSEENAFEFLKADSPGDYITYPGFCQALHQVLMFDEDYAAVFNIIKVHDLVLCLELMQLGLTGHRDGLIPEDAKDLWTEADIDGNGMVDYDEFQVNFKSAFGKTASTCGGS